MGGNYLSQDSGFCLDYFCLLFGSEEENSRMHFSWTDFKSVVQYYLELKKSFLFLFPTIWNRTLAGYRHECSC
jgi:hypothetical protein